MAFQNLRSNSEVFILNKNGEPTLEIGKVVGEPQQRYEQPKQQGITYQAFQAPLKVIDISVKTNDASNKIEGLPATYELSDISNGFVVATNRDVITNYVKSWKDELDRHIANYKQYKTSSAGCDKILLQLNPELAEKAKHAEDMASLQSEVAEMRESNKRLEDMVSRLLGQLESRPKSK